jgi:antimicrobial peptide system SdpA family protein
MSHSRIRLVTRIGLVFVWAFSLGHVIRALNDNPMRISQKTTMNLMMVLPEGWAFFTKNPREPNHYMFARQGQGWTRIGTTNSDASNLFGIRRTSRLKDVEMAMMLTRVPADSWQPVRARVGEPAREIPGAPVPVQNRALRPSLCGEYLVQHMPPVPWAWSTRRKEIAMRSRAVRLVVSCGEKAPPQPAAARATG